MREDDRTEVLWVILSIFGAGIGFGICFCWLMMILFVG